MRGTYIRDAYIPKLGRVHIFQDTESTTHFHYLAINSDRTGRVRRSDTVFIKEKNENRASSPKGPSGSGSAMAGGHPGPLQVGSRSDLVEGQSDVEFPADDDDAEVSQTRVRR